MTTKLNFLFSHNYRPSFLLASLGLIFYPMYVITGLLNFYPFPGQYLDLIQWHGHELMHGAISLIIFGFLTTASEHWTKKKVFKNKKSLILVILLWLLTRLILIIQPSPILILILPLFFNFYLLYLMVVILRGHNMIWKIILPISLLCLSHALYLLEHLDYFIILYNYRFPREIGLNLYQFSIFLLLFTLSSKLIPFFTNASLKEHNVYINTSLERLCLLTTIILFSMLILAEEKDILIASLAIITGTLILIRSVILIEKRALKNFMISSLYIANTWFPVFFYLIAYEVLFPESIYARPSLHALFAGVLGCYFISIMTRVSLGHSNLEIKAEKWFFVAFFCIFIGSLLRVFWPLFIQELTSFSMHISMGLWTLGFIFFILRFTKIFLRDVNT